MNCLDCKFRVALVGTHHSGCSAFDKSLELKIKISALLMFVNNIEFSPGVYIKINPHGIKNGWATYPFNFDPIWINECKLFTQK